MRRRAAAASVLSASAVLLITWQVGAQARTDTVAETNTTTAGTTNGTTDSGTSATTDSGTASADSSSGTSDATTTAAPDPAAASGTFTGTDEQTRFGNVQVQITVADGTITDVTALHLTDDDGRSVQISNRAAPVLRSEVLSAQSSSVQMVSGATYTSEAYLSSLQSAIDQAGL